jgi:Bacterial TSP3 repeat
MRLIKWVAAAAVVAALGGCSETVSFLTVDLKLPVWSPEISCKEDPRRAEKVQVRATCGEEVVEGEALVSAGSVGLEGLPMSECEVGVAAVNKHGRTVLHGKGSSTLLARGANESLTITLLEPACDKTTSCDTDGDGLPDVDEEGLGTDPEEIDTDGDGLQDGLELVECCTDPVSASDAQCSKFLIQGVYPGLGPAGTAVLIRATTTLKQPSASVGGKALDNLFADSTIVLGQVAKDATLGEVVLSSDKGASSATYEHLFAVLAGQPELVTEISQKASGITPPMFQLVDQAFAGTRHFLLGASAGSSAGSTGGLPILIQRDRSKPGGDVRIVAKAGGQPLGLAVSAKMLLVLTQSGGLGRLSVYPVGPSGAQLLLGKQVIYPPSVKVLLKSPLGLRVEPSGATFQLLTREVLFRFHVDGSGTLAAGAAVELRRLLPGGNLPTVAGAAPACTGGIFHVPKSGAGLNSGSTYLSCNAALPCAAGSSCPPGQGMLVRVPVSCLKLSTSFKLAEPNAACGASVHPLDFSGQLAGAPVVDSAQNRLFVLSSRGVVVTGADKPAKLLKLQIGFDWQRKTASQHLMALWGKQLFVVDGPRVRRLEPYRATGTERQGRSFPAGSIAEEATMVLLPPDGRVLSVGRRFYGSVSSLMAVCLAAPCGL